jgi:methylase of polypeptide subunit release factors
LTSITGRQASLFDDEERLRVNVFDGQAEFPDIIKSGGFDAVIGNPPYVRQEMLGEFKESLQKQYEVSLFWSFVSGRILASLFLEQNALSFRNTCARSVRPRAFFPIEGELLFEV